MKKINIGIIGTGLISQEYIKILKKIDLNVSIICARKKKKLIKFCLQNKIKKNTVEINNLLKESLDGIIVCASPESSFYISKKLINFNGIILFEKPVGLNLAETSKIYNLYKNKNNFFVALNRRYYHSVLLSKKLLEKSKQKKLITIYDQENTILAKKIGHHNKTIKNWMYANSVHLVDLINFFIKSKINSIVSNKKNYKNSSIYNSNIKFKNGDEVEFKSFWNMPGPWKIDIFTKSIFIQLMPIESINYRTKKKKD